MHHMYVFQRTWTTGHNWFLSKPHGWTIRHHMCLKECYIFSSCSWDGTATWPSVQRPWRKTPGVLYTLMGTIKMPPLHFPWPWELCSCFPWGQGSGLRLQEETKAFPWQVSTLPLIFLPMWLRVRSYVTRRGYDLSLTGVWAFPHSLPQCGS